MISISIRLWILWISLAGAIVSIIWAKPTTKLMVFLLFIGIPLTISLVKRKVGRIFVILVFSCIILILLYSSAQNGAIIKSISKDSPLLDQGVKEGEIITNINNKEIKNFEDYSLIVSNLSSQEVRRLDIVTDRNSYILFTNESLGITVSNVPKTKIKTGLDISGGARALVKPIEDISEAQLQDLISVSRNRFNVFGLSDVTIKGVTDLSGQKFILVEVAGATPEDLRELISQQGKFEAKIKDEVVFVGGEKDITNVCRNDATCAAVTNCFQQGSEFVCQFSFSITLSSEAARRHAEITSKIPLDLQSGSRYLSENLTLVLDDQIVDQLLISSGLKGQVTSEISIQGSGSGATQELAYENAREDMHKLQTILITGSLPYKLEIVKLDSISPALGLAFTKSLIILGILVFILVSVAIFVRYRKLNLSLAVILTMFSEAVITLGLAALIGWNLDAPGIAGIIAGMGTGVNDQIVLIDESVSKRKDSLKQRIRRALFIIFGAFFTIVAAMIPLFWTGAGLLRGFALTTIIGVTVGVLITRPAFADIIRQTGEK